MRSRGQEHCTLPLAPAAIPEVFMVGQWRETVDPGEPDSVANLDQCGLGRVQSKTREALVFETGLFAQVQRGLFLWRSVTFDQQQPARHR